MAHQPALLVHLAIREGVLVALVGVVAALVLDTDRRTDQFQHAAEGVFQVARVGLRHRVHLVAVDHDQRRVGTAEVGIAQLDAAPADHRRLVLLHRVLEDLRQPVSRPAGDRRGERGLHRFVQVAHAGAVQRGDEVDVGVVDEEQPALQLGLHVIALTRLHAVPLVQRDHQRPTGLDGEAEQVEVVVDHAFAGVHDEDHHVGVLDRLQRLHHRELLDFLVDLAALAHAGGVDQRVLLVVALEGDVDAVAGGAGLVIDHHAVFAEHAVDQGRLAHVGPADDGDLDAVLLARAGNALGFLAFGDVLVEGVLFLVAGEVAQRHFEHLGDAATVRAGNRQRLAKAHRGEFGPGDVRVDVVDLVHHQVTALVALAQVLANHLVARGQPGTGVDQEQHDISFLDGQQRLLGHLLVDALLVAGNAAGVDQNVAAPFPLGFAVLTIAGQARQVTDDRVAGAGQAVEQGRLAHVGAAHQGDYRNHWLLQR